MNALITVREGPPVGLEFFWKPGLVRSRSSRVKRPFSIPCEACSQWSFDRMPAPSRQPQ